jgi:hypothetical protein
MLNYSENQSAWLGIFLYPSDLYKKILYEKARCFEEAEINLWF